MSDDQHRVKLKNAYSDESVSDSYIEQRFKSAIGRILHEAQVKFVVDAISRYKIRKVLEIAPGPARLTVDIGSACCETEGIITDINNNMLDQANKRLSAAGLSDKWKSIVGDAFDLPLSDIFQLVYTFRFIRHFHLEDRVRIYRQIAERLESNGYLIFDVINRNVSEPLREKTSPEKYPIYDELYDFPQIQTEMESNGFKIIKYVPVQNSYTFLNAIQIFIGPRSGKLAYILMKLIETMRIGQPLEWIVLCQKM